MTSGERGYVVRGTDMDLIIQRYQRSFLSWGLEVTHFLKF